ncbi:hypothetical protein [Candidatus Tisiphia endosymbiont of Ditula angustiorana]|uniref:hypothetical protein n=1 Tax=Candidatus Tisiphia endosymbiont of Ditula angustiorana TaxID=3066272 RepID=UPI00312C81B5
MKAARIKIERNQQQYQDQNVVSLSKKKNRPQEVVINDTIKQTSTTPEVIPQTVSQTMPQTVEQARKHYAISSNNVDSQNIIEANDAIAEKVKELNQLEEIHQQLLCKEDSLKLEVMNYMQFHVYLKKGDHILVSWKHATRKTFDLPKFKGDYPEIYGEYVKEISPRLFRLY